MADVTVIGRGTRVRGRVAGSTDLEVLGFVDGEIAIDGDVTVDTHGMVAAGIRGRRLVVRGAVKGDLNGEQAILLEDGARVVGDVRAPRVAIAAGALVRGYVQTSGVEAGAPRAKAAQVARPAPKPAVKAAPPPPKSAPAQKAPPPKPASTNHAPATRHAPVALAGGAPAKAPPPPVVPALKKGAKGALNKKRAH